MLFIFRPCCEDAMPYVGVIILINTLILRDAAFNIADIDAMPLCLRFTAPPLMIRYATILSTHHTTDDTRDITDRPITFHHYPTIDTLVGDRHDRQYKAYLLGYVDAAESSYAEYSLATGCYAFADAIYDCR